MFRTHSLNGLFLGALPLLFATFISSSAARANTIVFATGVQHLTSEISAEAQFDIDTTAQTVTIHLLNLENNPSGITSVLGSLRFNITGAGATPAPVEVSDNVSTFGIDGSGNPFTQNAADAWKASNIGGNTIAFCTTCANGGNNVLIIGGPNASGTYTGNGSIRSHSPFIIGSGQVYSSPSALAGLDTAPSWTFKFSGITPGQPVVISNVVFGFGTGQNYGTDFYTMQTYTEIDAPEPETYVLGMTGFGLMLASAALRRFGRSRS
jgi:hypothetical protein